LQNITCVVSVAGEISYWLLTDNRLLNARRCVHRGICRDLRIVTKPIKPGGESIIWG